MPTDTRPLLSRVADSLYWMARYMERAENVARLLEVNLHLQLDLPLDGNQWQPVIDTCGESAVFRKRYGEATQESVVAFLAQDRDYSNSITSCLLAARENARSVRETISSETWEHVNGIYLRVLKQYAKPAEELSPEVFRDLRLAGHMFQGITDATMSHNEAWHFVRLGRQMERADKTSRLLDVKYFMLLPSATRVGTPYDDLLWSAVLKSASAFEMYRQCCGKISPREVVKFLVLDPDFPRSIRHSVARAADSLDVIRQGEKNGAWEFEYSYPLYFQDGTSAGTEMGYFSRKVVGGKKYNCLLSGLSQKKLEAVIEACESIAPAKTVAAK